MTTSLIPDSNPPNPNPPNSNPPNSNSPNSNSPNSNSPNSNSPDSNSPDSNSPDSSTDYQDYLVTGDGICQGFIPPDHTSPIEPYRLYRFLTDLETILAEETDSIQRLHRIAPIVRTLLTSSDWLQLEYVNPSPKTGWGVKFLYREPKFPLTVQMVSWAPGQKSTIHNHATWGIVALISGEERNHFWRRTPTPGHPHALESAGTQILVPGDIIGFVPDAIHQVEALGDEPTISFNLYGVTTRSERYQFDPEAGTAKLF